MSDEPRAYVQLRPAVAFVPTVCVPGEDPTQIVDRLYVTPYWSPVDEDNNVFTKVFDPIYPATTDVRVHYLAKVNMNLPDAELFSMIAGSESILIGDLFSAEDPSRLLVWMGGIVGAPDCSDTPSSKTLVIPKEEWNSKIVPGPARFYAIFQFPYNTPYCSGSFLQVDFTYRGVSEEGEFVHTAPTYLGLRSYGRTHLGCTTTSRYRGTPRYKWAEWAIDPHTATIRPMVRSMQYNNMGPVSPGGETDYSMVSLGGLDVSPEEERPHLPGSCTTIFPMRGHTRGSVVRILGEGVCINE